MEQVAGESHEAMILRISAKARTDIYHLYDSHTERLDYADMGSTHDRIIR